MILEHNGIAPRIDPSTRIAPNAVICGDVEIGPNCSIGFGAVLTAESGSIRLQSNIVVMENAVIRGVRKNMVEISDNVLIGPRAYLTGCRVEANAFLATGVTVFNGAVIGAGAELRINAVVHIRTRIANNTTVPIGWVAVGDPASIYPASNHDEIWGVQKSLNFPKYVFGVERSKDPDNAMSDIMPRYATALRRWHSKDRTLNSDN